MTQAYDIIGDIHGHSEALTALLSKMDYEQKNGTWSHPERKVIFIGDFVDLGPKQVDTVMIAKGMVEAGSAFAVMGNHELNAVAWYLPDPANPGEYLRPHCSEKWGSKNRLQHAAFLAEVKDKPEMHREIIEWFLSLPLWLELEEVRVVHACWHPALIQCLAPTLDPGQRLSKDLMAAVTREQETDEEMASNEPSPFKAVEMLTKGMEIPLPGGLSFKDKFGIERKRVRVRWWDHDATTYRSAAIVENELRDRLPDLPIPPFSRVRFPTDKPIFIGHYWLTGEQAPLSENVVCVDYSAGKGGPLCAYRWQGEPMLNAENFCCIQQG
jgi:diadenosine tetraphosphatase ApaH/serine/threonine PP2A family protein phosphatase